MKIYTVQVVMSYLQTIDVEAADEIEAAATALDLFDVTQATEGDGEFVIVDVVEDIEDNAGLTRADLAQFYGPSVRI